VAFAISTFPPPVPWPHEWLYALHDANLNTTARPVASAAARVHNAAVWRGAEGGSTVFLKLACLLAVAVTLLPLTPALAAGLAVWDGNVDRQQVEKACQQWLQLVDAAK